MGNEQKQENLNNQNIQEQEPKQMMPYVDNQDMKERATRFGTGGFAAIIYAVVTTICLYKNAYGIMTVLFAAVIAPSSTFLNLSAPAWQIGHSAGAASPS